MRIYIKPEPEMNYKDGLYKVNVWIMRVLLLLTFVLYDFYSVNLSIADTVMITPMVGVMPPVGVYIFMHLMSAALSVVMFEVIANVFYTLIRPICPPVELNRKGFMVYVRFAYVLRNVIGGLVKLLFFAGDMYFFIYVELINVCVTTLVVILIYAYVNKKYVPEKAKAAFLRGVWVPYLAVEFISVLAGLLI